MGGGRGRGRLRTDFFVGWRRVWGRQSGGTVVGGCWRTVPGSKVEGVRENRFRFAVRRNGGVKKEGG